MNLHVQKIKEFWLRNNTKIVLILILFVFLSYSLFLATNLKRGIIPDEPAHLIFSKHYSTTWGIPKDIFETYSQGWYIQHNPFLYYWINGRVINLIQTIFPLISEWQILISLRILSVLYSIGTLLFCYLLSKEVVKGKWWQIVPVFLLSNTLMFVFLSGGVNYDNLANLLSMAGLVFLFRVLNKKSFVLNSILWMIFISFGALVKFTILPLALIMFIVWALFIYKNRNNLSLKVIRSNKIIILGIILVFAIVGNFRIYGVNIIKFGSLLPDCNQILPDEICELSPYVQRFNEIGLENKLSIKESIQLGYPNPLEYFFDSWIDFMLYRIYGILGHMSYFPSHIIIFYKILFFWIILLGFRYIEKPSFTFFSFLGIIGFYCCVLFIKNFSSELAYGFKQIAIQGRYLFPVIGLIYVLIPYTLEKNQNKPVRILTLSIAILLFFVGGPLKFVTHNQSIFLEWFIY